MLEAPFLYTASPAGPSGGGEDPLSRWDREEATEPNRRKKADPITSLLRADGFRPNVPLMDPRTRRWYRFQRVYPQTNLRVALHARTRKTPAWEIDGRRSACEAVGLKFVTFMSGETLDPQAFLAAAGRA